MTDIKSTSVDMAPTKAFFVDMLIRDIELEDSILDLLDNCVDGALRSAPRTECSDQPYEGFYAELEFSKEQFSISDNCGGISDDVRDSAFHLGRPPGDHTDENLPTVGIYGIGMKRAIFKLGFHSLIETHTRGTGFSVEINKEWMGKEGEWKIPVIELKGSEKPGTTIIVGDLRPEVLAKFDGPTSFVDSFRSRVSQYYSVLIAKGFTVKIAGERVNPSPLSLRTVDLTLQTEEGAISPFVYEGKYGSVNVELSLGFFAPYNIDPDEDPTAGRAEDAGWTIVCNDRIVVYKDKTILTGWGDGAPNYHPQFRQIAGLATFTSDNPKDLPITTTKRGIDAQNPVFLETRIKMREGLRLFTGFTNTLKKYEAEERENLFKATAPVDVASLRIQTASLPAERWHKDRGGSGRTLTPKLPSPKVSTNKRIVFARPASQVKKLGTYLMDEADASASDVGAAAFDYVLQEAKAQR